MAALLAAGADVNAADMHGRTALDIARSREEPEKVKLLLRSPRRKKRP